MAKAYYLSQDRFRLKGLNADLCRTIELLWRDSGGKADRENDRVLELFEGSPTRFTHLAEALGKNHKAEVGKLIREKLDGVTRRNWKLPLAGGGFLEVGLKPLIMGVVNVTPDSFSDGGAFFDAGKAIAQGNRLVQEGADILDIGGESTRPGAEPVSVDEECRRVLPVIERLAADIQIPISIDTRKPEVANRALAIGAKIVNDVTMLTYDPALAEAASKTGATLVISHIRGTPADMQRDPHYDDLWPEIIDDLEAAMKRALERGVIENAIVLDPGIGFGKTLEHNLKILKGLHALTACGLPVMVGPSRKRFIGAVLDLPPEKRLEGTLAACVVAMMNGATIFRVHDVLPHRRALDLAWAIYKA